MVLGRRPQPAVDVPLAATGPACIAVASTSAEPGIYSRFRFTLGLVAAAAKPCAGAVSVPGQPQTGPVQL